MEKVIYLDMDGTIADLYMVEGWLDALRRSDPFPYLSAKPMWDMEKLIQVIEELKSSGYIIGVITWLSKDSTKDYDREVRKAKKLWLKSHGLWEHLDEVHMVKYGTPKHTTAKVKHGILVDDNHGICEDWERYGGATINPTNNNLIEALLGLIEKEER